MSVFTFVQSTPGTASGALSQAFTGNTVAGNCIIVVVYAIFSGLTITPGATSDVTDSQGNQYYALQQSYNHTLGIYVATNIKGGPLTVTCNVTSPQASGILGMEYHSSVTPYYVCPGSSQTTDGKVTNVDTGFADSGVDPYNFQTTEECTCVFAGFVNADVGSGWTAQTGTIRFTGDMPQDFGVGGCAGDDVIATLPSPDLYGNQIMAGGFGADGFRCCVFLNQGNSTCPNCVVGSPPSISCGNPPSGTVGTAYSHTFPVVDGVPPYTFAIISGALPTGINLNTSTGNASGTPSVSGTSFFSIQVTDSNSASAATACSISIAAGGTGGSGAIGAGGGQASSENCVPLCGRTVKFERKRMAHPELLKQANFILDACGRQVQPANQRWVDIPAHINYVRFLPGSEPNGSDDIGGLMHKGKVPFFLRALTAQALPRATQGVYWRLRFADGRYQQNEMSSHAMAFGFGSDRQLFSPEVEWKPGEKMYIDLDTIIAGPPPSSGYTVQMMFEGVYRFPLVGGAGGISNPIAVDMPRYFRNANQNILAPGWMSSSQCPPETPAGYQDSNFIYVTPVVNLPITGQPVSNVSLQIATDSDFICREIFPYIPAATGSGSPVVRMRRSDGYVIASQFCPINSIEGPMFKELRLPAGSTLTFDAALVDTSGSAGTYVTFGLYLGGVKRRKVILSA